MRLGIDLDGVILNNLPYWNKRIHEKDEEHNHGTWEPPVYWETWNHGYNVCRDCFYNAYHDPDLFREIKTLPLASTILYNLSRSNELFLLTSSPHSPRDIEAKLEENNCMWFTEGFYGIKDKASICHWNNIDYMIDDAPHNIESIYSKCNKTIPIVFDWKGLYKYNHHVNYGIRMTNWPQIGRFFAMMEKMDG